MSANAIERRLNELKIGCTTTVNGKVVTRWTADRWEVTTWGRESVSLDEAVHQISG